MGDREVDLQKIPFVASKLEWLMALTGADGGYGFFAPGVDGQIRARFKIFESEGPPKTIQLEEGKNSELDLRIGDIIEQFDHESQDSDPLSFQRQLAASLSGAALARYPGAKSVAVELEEYKQISMQDYRNGRRPVWNLVYSAQFKPAEVER